MGTSLAPEVSNLTLKSRYQTGKTPSSFRLKRDFKLLAFLQKRKLEAASAEMIVRARAVSSRWLLICESTPNARPSHICDRRQKLHHVALIRRGDDDYSVLPSVARILANYALDAVLGGSRRGA
jgi:hypothetical protein